MNGIWRKPSLPNARAAFRWVAFRTAPLLAGWVIIGCAGSLEPVGPIPPFRQPLYIGITLHLEGWADPSSSLVPLAETVALIERAGGKATLDAGVAGTGYAASGDLAGYHADGHAVGLHADLCGSSSALTRPECASSTTMATELAAMRAALAGDAGIALEDIRHISAACSELDWVEAVRDAGFRMAAGIVDYCLMSLPDSHKLYPAPACTTPASCHEPFPGTIPELLHPWIARDSPLAGDWTEPATTWPSSVGGLGIIPGVGPLNCLDPPGVCPGTYSPADADAFFDLLDEALRHHLFIHHDDFLHVKINLGDPGPVGLWNDLLSRLHSDYVVPGKVRWMTLPEMYDTHRSTLPKPDLRPVP